MDFRKSFRWESRKNKPLMLLKDYLLDDLSSCSSNRFKSLLRRPSFSSTLSTSVRFLIDGDLSPAIPPTKNGLSRSSSTALFCKAAMKLVNAVKSPSRTTCFLLHGSGHAGKYFKNEAEEDIGRENSYCGEESIKWGRDVATSILEWLKEKEKFSPISVLDCPFEDDEGTVDAQSESSRANIGTRNGCHRRDGLSQLVLVQLEKIIASPELEEETTAPLDESILSPSKTTCLIEEDNTEAILERMLKTMRAVDVPSYSSKSDVLFRDFFREKITEWEEHQYVRVFRGRNTLEDEVVHATKDWACG